MTAGGWVAVAFLAEFAAAAAVFRGLRRRAGGSPAPGSGHHPARAPHSPAPGNNPVPGTTTPKVTPRPPARPSPAPGLTPHETAALERIHRARIAVPPRGAYAAQVIADGLRERFPHLDDTTLGVITLDLFGYAHALAAGLPDHAAALRAIVDSFGLAAEDLTRLARVEEVHFDQH